MNIVEAIKSGKRFKRASQPNPDCWYHSGSGLTFYVNDVLADDWEIEEISCCAGSVTITREDFDNFDYKSSVRRRGKLGSL